MTRKYDARTLERMLYRRQFLLGPKKLEGFPTWQRLDLGRQFHLAVHPDLELCRVVRGNKSITLLGYALDPHNPGAGNVDILDDLVQKLDRCDDFFQCTESLGGRWVLVVDDGTRAIVFSDAVGMRQVFYTRGISTWCASQPGLLADVLGLALDEAALAFTRTDRYAHNTNASTWYPGDTTPFADVRLLLPNHYLDLATGLPHRYWPRTNLEPLRFDEGVQKSLRALRGLMESARRRFKLSVAMTAGWDSRLVLAATREMAAQVVYFTGIFWHMTEDHIDAAVPSRLLASLGLNNQLIACKGDPDADFLGVFKRNVVMAHDAYAAVAQGMFDHAPSDRVCTKGDVAEIVKCHFRIDKANGAPIDSHDLAKLSEMDPHPFVIKAFDDWLAGVRTCNIHLLDLYCWEQAMGGLEAMIEAECDLVQEAFSPLNSRDLLTTMLRIREKHRRPPSFDLFKTLIEELWPEALDEPINAQVQTGPKALFRRTIQRLDVHHWAPRSLRRLGRKLLS
jgi:hypothetical protein